MKHIVGFSGGIDSQATARWVLNRLPPMRPRMTRDTDWARKEMEKAAQKAQVLTSLPEGES